ncbi:MAG TPA: HD domain-containing phosphohydrolase [Longimicrobiales bacterium]|nr:HD domain-containing phosphohydrolase [Longimicrobiales bacterium]
MSTAQSGVQAQGGGAIQTFGLQLLTALYAALQSLKLYPIENATVQQSLDELHRVAARIIKVEGVITLRLAEEFLFLNDSRLRLDLANYAAFSFVTGMLRRHGIAALDVMADVQRDEWAPLLSLLLRANDGETTADPFPSIAARLAATPVRHIAIGPESAAAVQPEDADENKRAAKRTYFQGVAVAREVLGDVRLGKAVNVRRVKRAVQGIVDQVLNNETSIMGMSTLRDYDEYTFTHCVNVCIFSVILGQRLGLAKLELYELGLGALLHDLGKQRIDPEVTKKTDSLSDEEWRLMQEHPSEGLLSLFSMRGFTDAPYRAMLIAYEHHMKTDLTGYPKNSRPRDPTLFSRIVAVADGFDAATSKRSYQSVPWPPDKVLAEMRDNPKRGYDPLLVKAFLNVTGVYPVGTLVILDTHEMAVVVQANPDPALLSQPIVKIVSNSMGMPLPEAVTVDLSEMDGAGNPRRTVIKTTTADRFGIDVGDYFA